MGGVSRGFRIYFRGLKLWLTHRGLLALSVVPFFFDFLCLGAGLYFTLTKGPLIAAHFLKKPDTWYRFVLYDAAVAVTVISLFFAVILIVFVISNMIMFPFNDLLAERTLQLARALPEKEKGLHPWFKKTARNAGAMFQKTLLLLAAAVLVFVATLIPVLGFIGAAFSVFLLAYDRVDYAFDHFEWSFKQRVSFMKSHIAEIIGFAAGLGLTAAIPVINMLVMPGSVVAGALLVADILKRNPSVERSHP